MEIIYNCAAAVAYTFVGCVCAISLGIVVCKMREEWRKAGKR